MKRDMYDPSINLPVLYATLLRELVLRFHHTKGVSD